MMRRMIGVAFMGVVLLLAVSGCQSPFVAPITHDVEKHGGGVSWEWSPKSVSFHDYSRSDEAQMDDAEFTEAHQALHWLCTLERLDMTSTNITDKSMPLIAEFKGLHHVYMASTHVTPEGVRVLKQLPRLEYLSVPSEQFSDDDVRRLQQEMPKVRMRRIPVSQASSVR